MKYLGVVGVVGLLLRRTKFKKAPTNPQNFKAMCWLLIEHIPIECLIKEIQLLGRVTQCAILSTNQLRGTFNRVSKVMRDCVGLTLHHFVIGWENSRILATNQMQTKTNCDLITGVFPRFKSLLAFILAYRWVLLICFFFCLGVVIIMVLVYDTQSKWAVNIKPIATWAWLLALVHIRLVLISILSLSALIVAFWPHSHQNLKMFKSCFVEHCLIFFSW